MKNTFLITGIILFILFAIPIVYACEPCLETLNFDETVEKSDLIIIGQRTDFSPSEIKPDSINVKIIEVLKGDINQNQITVNSWDGMCAYGIMVNDKNYVMLLQERDNQYDAVNYGCAVKTFLVENNMVDFEGNKITVNEFTNKLGSQVTPYLYYIIPVIIILGGIIFIIIKIKKK